ncbi:MAG: aminopeptidase [Defluviitaleaceae bacterium]|nr:aminopeptidase [Defluviitaleaceae bacterium]
MYFYELADAANKLVNDMLGLKPGETFVITADTESDMDVVRATASAAFAVGAKPMVITYPAPHGVGKAADPMLPTDALTGALLNADAWVEFNNQWMLYSTPFERAMAGNKKLRYICLVGMDADMMTRLIGRVDQQKLSGFLRAVADMTLAAKTMKITTPSGCDLAFELNPENTLSCDSGEAKTPGIHMLGGQICFIPKLTSINGQLVFEGAILPVPGVISEPVIMTVEKGIIREIKGGASAAVFRNWLESFNDPSMFRLAHGCYGLNPGAKVTGKVLEDERVWGATEWGIGYLSVYDAPKEHFDAPSHCDGLCLNSSVWLDGKQIMDTGKFTEPRLKKMAQELGKE